MSSSAANLRSALPSVLFLVLAAFMLFWGLGHYALWDDESMTALAANGVIVTGDTSAIHGDNVTAYRSGLLLKELHDRSTPPLTSYLVALSIKVLGPSSLSARLPCSLVGLGLMVLVVFLVSHFRLPPLEACVWYLAITGNVSLFLFLRQSRYYAPTILLTVMISVLYLFWRKGRERSLVAVVLLFAVLFAVNYMACIALFLCLALDYFLWRRSEVVIPVARLAPWVLGAAVFCLLVASVWNPFATQFGAYTQTNTWMDRLSLFFWNLRDMNACGFLAVGLMITAVYQALFRKDHWLLRGLVALLTYVTIITSVSPQLVGGAALADVRYLAPAIPLCIALSARAYLGLFKNKKILALLFALPVFWTNLVSGTFLEQQGLRVLPLEYMEELLFSPTEPYTPVAKWINENAPRHSSIWVLPDYMTYPLMYHAPDAVYAWQLRPDQKKEEQFKSLPDIHFQGLISPDYIVVFGPSVMQIRALLQKWKEMGVQYDEISRVNTFWKDLYRPELFWRTFKPITEFDPETQGVYILKRTTPATGAQNIN